MREKKRENRKMRKSFEEMYEKRKNNFEKCKKGIYIFILCIV